MDWQIQLISSFLPFFNSCNSAQQIRLKCLVLPSIGIEETTTIHVCNFVKTIVKILQFFLVYFAGKFDVYFPQNTLQLSCSCFGLRRNASPGRHGGYRFAWNWCLTPRKFFLKSMIIQSIFCLISNLWNFGTYVSLLASASAAWHDIERRSRGTTRKYNKVCNPYIKFSKNLKCTLNFDRSLWNSLILIFQCTLQHISGSPFFESAYQLSWAQEWQQYLARPALLLQQLSLARRVPPFNWNNPGRRSQLPLKPTSWKNLSFSAVKFFLAENSSVALWVPVHSFV